MVFEVVQLQSSHPGLLVQVQQHLVGTDHKEQQSILQVPHYQYNRAHLLLQLILPVVDGEGVIMPAQAMDESLREEE